jgi:aspartyl-tRNA(Asn)/glutamyl-tRNA(Gln) amidotransferase subunit C
MSTISVNDVQKLAQLSALSLSDDEVASLANELTNILGYVEQLNDVDTDGVEPTYQVTGLHTVTRPDEIIDYGVSQQDLLKNAPDVQDGQMKVPRVLG